MDEKKKNEIKPVETEVISVGGFADYVPPGNYRLTPEQKKAAQMIVANEMTPKKAGVKKKTYIQLAKELGIHRDTLLGWRSLPEFQRFVNDMTALSIGGMHSMAVARLYEMANGDQTGTSSIKAIELILQMNGLVKKQYEHSVTNHITVNNLKEVSDDELIELIGEYDEKEE